MTPKELLSHNDEILEEYGFEVDEEFVSEIPPLKNSEFDLLEQSIRHDGLIDPFRIWADPRTQRTFLIDGHHRLSVCLKIESEADEHGDPKRVLWRVASVKLSSRLHAVAWVLEHQAGRRNLGKYRRSLLAAKLEETLGVLAKERQQLAGKERAQDERDEKGRLQLPQNSSEAGQKTAGSGSSKIKPAKKKGAKKQQQQQKSSNQEGEARVQAAQTFDVSHDTMKKAKWLKENADDETLEKLESGDTTINKEFTRFNRAEKKDQIRQKIAAQPAPDTDEGPFDVLLVDVPWKYDKRPTDPTQRGQTPYPPMTIEEIIAFSLPSKRAKADSILWFWTTNAHMHEAYHIIDAWGFSPRTILTWVKNKMGTGDWLRGKTEHCIMAIRGKPFVELTNQTTILEGKVREHSRKPDEFYEMVHLLCPGSKVEFFGREQREGIVVVGVEKDKFAEDSEL